MISKKKEEKLWNDRCPDGQLQNPNDLNPPYEKLGK